MQAELSSTSSSQGTFSLETRSTSPDHSHHRRIPLSLPPTDYYQHRTANSGGNNSNTMPASSNAYKNSVRRLIRRQDASLTPEEPSLPPNLFDNKLTNVNTVPSTSKECSAFVRLEPRKSNCYDGLASKPKEPESLKFEGTSNLKSYYATFLEEISAFNEAKKNVAKNSVCKTGRRHDCSFDTKEEMNKYLCNIDHMENELVGVTKGKSEKKYPIDHTEPTRVYEAVSKCSNDADSINSFKSDNSSKIATKQPTYPGKVLNHYVDMGRTYKENTTQSSIGNRTKESPNRQEKESKVYNRALQDNSNRIQNGRKSDKIIRRHTTEYRGPPHLVLPPLKNDSSDSAERSPVAIQNNSNNPYPYLMLNEQRGLKKKSSITSSTSEENSDAIAAAIKLRMQAKEWRENKAPKRVDSLTVDRRMTNKKNASKSAKIKRRGSFNIDPSGEFHLSLDVDREKDMSCSVRSCNTAKSPLMDARKTPLQISAEDMVQMANCGARNKNGSLCHFISANNDNYLSISQALLDQSSGSEAKLAETRIPAKKQHSMEKNLKKKSTHSLAFESSDETLMLNQDERQPPPPPPKFNENMKAESIDRRHGKGHSRQRSHDLERAMKSVKHKQDSTSGRKLVHTKSEGHRAHKAPAGYFLLEDENGCTVPLRLPDTSQWKEDVKYQSPSVEMLDKKIRSNHQLCDSKATDSKDACKCAGVSNHSLVKVECSFREKSDFSSGTDLNQSTERDTDPGNPVFRRLGTSSREELTNSGGDVEECFDF